MGKEKDTLCWSCQNFAKCSWAMGVPVEGWEATPTKIVGRTEIIDSYCVHSCPQYEADTIQLTNIKKIAQIVGKGERTIFRWLTNRKDKICLRKLLLEKGYKLYCSKGLYPQTTEYYLERVENESKNK